MSRWIWLVVAGLLGLSSPGWATQDVASTLVRQTSERMLTTLKARRTEVDQRPELIYRLVGEIVVPHFDFQRITQSALGRHWGQATPAQQQALTAAFQEILVRTYAKALLSYSGQEIIYLPLRPGRDAGDVTVATQVQEPGAPPVPINYRLYLKEGVWQVYDVVIDNVSLIANYRSSFATRIRSEGIDGLIQSLNQMNRGGQQ